MEPIGGHSEGMRWPSPLTYLFPPPPLSRSAPGFHAHWLNFLAGWLLVKCFSLINTCYLSIFTVNNQVLIAEMLFSDVASISFINFNFWRLRLSMIIYSHIFMIFKVIIFCIWQKSCWFSVIFAMITRKWTELLIIFSQKLKLKLLTKTKTII